MIVWAMRTSSIARLFLLSLSLGAAALAQDTQKTKSAGKPIATIRSEASAPVSLEYRRGRQWQQIQLEPGKAAIIPGDRMRVATRRADGAVLTVDLPIEAGKRYKLIWNSQANMWDFSPVS
jgi:hypothetical protein